ncbi:MAG: PhzF family phenazine biosynthesis protein [Acidobacteria bacterium]|nr:PhzF family phenazine biosynthesis protein [Acidobacteriota bacterium]
MEIPIYQVDAFTDHVFGGNPAAICPLTRWLPDATLQAIAAENNLAETAFFVPEAECYRLRWFTPTVEMPLCGHATLASAHVILHHLAPAASLLRFQTLSGELTVARDGDKLVLDFPARPGVRIAPLAALHEALGAHPLEILQAPYYLAVFAHEDDVRTLQPDFRLLAALAPVICTAPGSDGIDFVSRFFAPSHGVDEDPVTGSAHCTLVPYWAGRLKKTTFRARQISRRVGELWLELKGDRVLMAGQGVEYLRGTITVPE